ncbi:MAG TPA: heme ABC transporter ATP-binding protein [Symbiobacteriaceae bacterium]|jgi:iron complex transport system ATP-binding protein|nr:heme ABC transporter ATP-binding protein [Symbiobacteriaceae bacterium]
MDLRVDGVTCGYGGAPVLHGLSLTVARGEFLAVVGPNGCGKSTLVKLISRVLRPAEGRVLLAGRDLSGYKQRELARHLAVVAQETGAEFDFTVEEVVALGRLPHLARFRGETEADRRAVREAMDATGTLHLKDRLVTRLSGGERQRVMVARALAQEPGLLLLDEPTAHLDIAHQVELLDLTRRLNREQGLTVVAVLHDLNLAAQYAHRLLMMKDGAVFADGAPSDVLTEEHVAAVYGSRVKVTRHPEEGTPHLILLSGEAERRPGSERAS